jgi:hypothetical protein
LDKGLAFTRQRAWIGGWFSNCGSNTEDSFLAQDCESEAVTTGELPIKVANSKAILQQSCLSVIRIPF